jgi:hypothetical protein
MTRLIAIIMCLLPFVGLRADGFPFDHRTHEVHGANLRLPLTEAQQIEVASTGRITFTNEQLGWLRLVYPKVPPKLRVIASTYNDGLDERAPNPVDCIWTTPTEVGITLRTKWDKGDYSFDSGEGAADAADIRISPTGLLYHEGKEISIGKAFEIVRTAKKPDGAPATDPPIIQITQPPPFRSSDDDEVANNKKATDLFTALAKYGESLKIAVHPIW